MNCGQVKSMNGGVALPQRQSACPVDQPRGAEDRLQPPRWQIDVKKAYEEEKDSERDGTAEDCISTPSSSAAAWATACCACIAATAATTSWLPSAASCAGFCPSCGARRMAQTAAHLVGHVIPHVPVRQWVLSLPILLRLLLAAQPRLVTPVLQVVHRVIRRGAGVR